MSQSPSRGRASGAKARAASGPSARGTLHPDSSPAHRLAVRVQHHPSRADRIAPLLERIAGFANTEVVSDPKPTASPETWRTHRACIESGLASDATHVLVIQDDALPCDDFASRVIDLVALEPEHLVCLFTPGFGFLRRIGLEAGKKRLAPFPVHAFVPLVAVVYPRDLGVSLLRWADATPWVGRRAKADDGLVASWARQRRLRPFMAVPSLCDHDDEVPSVIRAGARSRGAHRRAAML